ncbi:MAG: AAA family ATPase [Planctomycetes bacterium]|nr:AAA family ATPase [Planctomycetota bacterium]
MFKQIRLRNFKSFAGPGEPIPLAPVTILVGANASGKSNLLDAFRFLQGVGRGLKIDEILTGKWEGGHKVSPGLRGGVQGVCWADSEAFSVEANVEVGEGETIGFEHQIACRVRPELAIQRESCEVRWEGLQFSLKPDDLSQEPASLRSGLTHSVDKPDGSNLQQNTELVYHRYCALVFHQYYEKMRFLDIRPELILKYVSLRVEALGEHGENLSAIVYRICQDQQKKEQYLDWLAALCAPAVKDIRAWKAEDDDVMFQLVEGNGTAKRISMESLSDGTLRFMGILAAMFDAPRGSLFLLEEIENGLHPTRVHLLVELLEQFAQSRDLQIIATTHSSQVLLGLSPEALADVVLFARPEESAGTVTKRLGDLPHFEEVTQKSSIDRLFTTGWMERAV